MKRAIALAVAAIILAGCGNTAPRSFIVEDGPDGTPVLVTCEYTRDLGNRDLDTCTVRNLQP